MNLENKKILLINLAEKTFESKIVTNLSHFIGGTPLGLKLMTEYYDDDPLIFSIGPLNGFFPFVSKTSIVLNNLGVIEDVYIGGTLSTRLKFSGYDSVIIKGQSTNPIILNVGQEGVSFLEPDTDIGSVGLPGRRSILSFTDVKFVADGYFGTPEHLIDQKIKQKNIHTMVVSGAETYKVNDFAKYNSLYNLIKSKTDLLTVTQDKYPSCSGCPVGCIKSKIGGIGGNVLVHALVACDFAEKIYGDLGIVFSCVNVLGYKYTHEDFENLSHLVEKTLKNLS